MVVVRMSILLRLYDSRSLKDKRSVVRSVRDRLRSRFNVAVAEVGALDQWREVALGVVTVASDQRVSDSEVEAITQFLDHDVRFEMVERRVEYV